jgi:hypothetical protein
MIVSTRRCTHQRANFGFRNRNVSIDIVLPGRSSWNVIVPPHAYRS